MGAFAIAGFLVLLSVRKYTTVMQDIVGIGVMDVIWSAQGSKHNQRFLEHSGWLFSIMIIIIINITNVKENEKTELETWLLINFLLESSATFKRLHIHIRFFL
jgi:hypothetical protein